MIGWLRGSPLFPYTALFRSEAMARGVPVVTSTRPSLGEIFGPAALLVDPSDDGAVSEAIARDRKSTRLNSSHLVISYAVFCLKKKEKRLVSRDNRPQQHIVV